MSFFLVKEGAMAERSSLSMLHFPTAYPGEQYLAIERVARKSEGFCYECNQFITDRSPESTLTSILRTNALFRFVSETFIIPFRKIPKLAERIKSEKMLDDRELIDQVDDLRHRILFAASDVSPWIGGNPGATPTQTEREEEGDYCARAAGVMVCAYPEETALLVAYVKEHEHTGNDEAMKAAYKGLASTAHSLGSLARHEMVVNQEPGGADYQKATVDVLEERFLNLVEPRRQALLRRDMNQGFMRIVPRGHEIREKISGTGNTKLIGPQDEVFTTLTPVLYPERVYHDADRFREQCAQTIWSPKLIDRQVSLGRTHAVVNIINDQLVKPLEAIPDVYRRLLSVTRSDEAFIAQVDAVLFGSPGEGATMRVTGTFAEYHKRVVNLLISQFQPLKDYLLQYLRASRGVTPEEAGLRILYSCTGSVAIRLCFALLRAHFVSLPTEEITEEYLASLPETQRSELMECLTEGRIDFPPPPHNGCTCTIQ
jgi:hypothetical protein